MGAGVRTPGRSRALAVAAQQPLQRRTEIEIVTRDGEVETVYVGKLFLNQISGLSRWVRDTLKRSLDEGKTRESLARLVQSATVAQWYLGEGSLEGLIDSAAVFLDETTLAVPFAIILDRSEEWCAQNLGLDDFGSILHALADRNSMDMLVTAFRRAVGTLSPRPSPPNSNGTEHASIEQASMSASSGDTASNG